MVSFLVQSDMWAHELSKIELHHRCFPMNIGNFYRTSILQNNAARLLLISCDIFTVLLPLSVINQSVIAWRYNIKNYVSNNVSIILLYQYHISYHISIDISIILLLYQYHYISINIISLVTYLHGQSQLELQY